MALILQTLSPDRRMGALANGQQVVKSFRYHLTDPRQFDILQSGPGLTGTECSSINWSAASSSHCSAARRARGRSRRARIHLTPEVGAKDHEKKIPHPRADGSPRGSVPQASDL